MNGSGAAWPGRRRQVMPDCRSMGVLDGNVAIVTGGGQGVGRGVALALAAEGANVAVAGRTVEKCEAVAAEVADRGGSAMAVRCDVTDRAEVDACVGEVVGRWGRIDVLVNSAQSKKYGSVKRMSEADVDDQWQSGPMGTLRAMQACLPHLIESQGCVVNMGSGSGLEAQAGMAAYAMVKESIRTLSRVAAVEWGRHGVRVNVICPLAESPGLEEWRSDMPGAFEAQVIN